jgi:hypothetical protein
MILLPEFNDILNDILARGNEIAMIFLPESNEIALISLPESYDKLPQDMINCHSNFIKNFINRWQIE